MGTNERRIKRNTLMHLLLRSTGFYGPLQKGNTHTWSDMNNTRGMVVATTTVLFRRTFPFDIPTRAHAQYEKYKKKKSNLIQIFTFYDSNGSYDGFEEYYCSNNRIHHKPRRIQIFPRRTTLRWRCEYNMFSQTVANLIRGQKDKGASG